jgi:hypothetical protein
MRKRSVFLGVDQPRPESREVIVILQAQPGNS